MAPKRKRESSSSSEPDDTESSSSSEPDGDEDDASPDDKSSSNKDLEDEHKQNRIRDYLFKRRSRKLRPRRWRFNDVNVFHQKLQEHAAAGKTLKSETRLARRDIQNYMSSSKSGWTTKSSSASSSSSSRVIPAQESPLLSFMNAKPEWQLMMEDCLRALNYTTQRFPQDKKFQFTRKHISTLCASLQHTSDEKTQLKKRKLDGRTNRKQEASQKVVRRIHPIHELLFTHRLTLDSWLKKQSFFMERSTSASSSSASVSTTTAILYSTLSMKEQQKIKYEIANRLLEGHPYPSDYKLFRKDWFESKCVRYESSDHDNITAEVDLTLTNHNPHQHVKFQVVFVHFQANCKVSYRKKQDVYTVGMIPVERELAPLFCGSHFLHRQLQTTGNNNMLTLINFPIVKTRGHWLHGRYPTRSNERQTHNYHRGSDWLYLDDNVAIVEKDSFSHVENLYRYMFALQHRETWILQLLPKELVVLMCEYLFRTLPWHR
jgi:hypothetical protein